jgi:hypothetical protein
MGRINTHLVYNPHGQPKRVITRHWECGRYHQPAVCCGRDAAVLLLLLLLQGLRPLVFFTRVGKPSIRMAVSGAGAEKKSADK